jgi:hypothetical protein
MYIKVFESRQSNKYYLLQYRLSENSGEQDRFHLENEKHKSRIVIESELFNSLDTLFREHSNEKRSKNDGQEDQRV